MPRYINADRFYKNAKEMAATQPPVHQNIILGLLKASEHFIEEDVEKVKQGEWNYDHWCEFKCSICGHWSKTEPRGKEKYCPNCGAEMKGVKKCKA